MTDSIANDHPGAPPVLVWHAEPEGLGIARDRLLQGIASLEEGRRAGRHSGAQLYVSRHGRPVLEFACGDALTGRALRPDSLMAWFSASKPVTALAIALLYDRGRLDLDDPVRRFLPRFANGKEGCTVRHVLTHQGGFPAPVPDEEEKCWEEIIAAICEAPAEYPPGTKAGYHPATGWYILGELVRVIDGRPIDRFVREEIFAPLGMSDSHMGIPPERQQALAGRLAQVVIGRSERPPFVDEAFISRWNGEREIARTNPGGGIRGPARDLGRFYEMMLAGGRAGDHRIVSRCTVELFTACHRWGLPDQTLANAPLVWGLGFALHGNADLPLGASRRVYGHSGMVSSVGMADPERQLACVVITNGLLDPLTNARRLRDVTGAAVGACRMA